jgi:hypothetical protein
MEHSCSWESVRKTRRKVGMGGRRAEAGEVRRPGQVCDMGRGQNG